MLAKLKDKRLKEMDKVLPTVADEDLSIPGLDPDEAIAIRYIITELRSFATLAAASLAHKEWDCHHWKPRKPSSPWSIKVKAQWRLLFEYDPKTHDITGMRYEQPH